MTRPFTPEEIAWHRQWKASSGHPGGWRITREDHSNTPLWSPRFQELTGPKGKLALFRSFENAKHRADKLNREQPVADTLAAEK